MDLKSVVPWGRSLNEYKDMFLLNDSDLNKTILGCGDGPACFNAEWTRMGGKVVSADPVYQFSPEQIKSKIEELYPEILEQMSKTAENYVWTNIGIRSLIERLEFGSGRGGTKICLRRIIRAGL